MLRVRLTRTAPASGVRVVPLTEAAPIPSFVAEAARIEGFTGRTGQTVDARINDLRVLLVGLGAAFESQAAEEAGALAAARLLAEPRIAIDARGRPAAIACALAAGACLRGAPQAQWRATPDPEAAKLSTVELLCDDPASVKPLWASTRAGLRGAELARDLVQAPANMLTPRAFAERLRTLSRHGLAVEVLGVRELQGAGLAGLLAVGGASANPPCLVVLRWAGDIEAPPVLLVGKGITFDTGGLCIKPADKMWEMRGDMGGAAACAGAMLAAALRRSPAPIVAVLPLAENATGATSHRPGDVLRLSGGTTVEIIDTDAEGRLVLADAIAWAIARFAPRAVIDIATLTGSIILALGPHRAGLFDTDPALAAHLAAAGEAVCERLWRLPIGARHREDLASDIADLKQCASGRFQPDACHAAAFLREFVGQTPWAHLDIAGQESRETACDRHPAGATGFGARLLDRLIAARFEDAERV